MSGARFQQELINVRARLNELENHRHDALYLPKDIFIGKNWLINGDFSEWQRGATFSSATGYHSVDRWGSDVAISGGKGESALGTYLEINSGVAYHLWQRIEVNPTLIGSKTFTLSFETDNSTEESFTLQIRYKNSVGTVLKQQDIGIVTLNAGEGTISSLTFSMPTYDTFTTGNYVELRLIANAATDTNKWLKAQLELGNKFTGFEYVLPAVNLLNCLRYYWNSGVLRWTAQNGGSNNYKTIPFPMPMRAVPAVTYSGFLDVDTTGLTISSFSRTPSGVTQIIMTGSDTIGKRYSIDSLEADAEI